MHCESSAMSWMSPNMQMETNTGGGIGKLFGRAITGESFVRCTYTARGNGMISFAATKPGQILPVQITPQRPIVAQKSAFLAMESGVDMDIFLQKKLGAGFFGGEGFIMQRFSGQGLAFLEIGGSLVEYDLGPGQVIMVDTGYLAANGPDLLHRYPDGQGREKRAVRRRGLVQPPASPARATSGCRPCRPRPWPAPSSPSCPSTAADGRRRPEVIRAPAAVFPAAGVLFPGKCLSSGGGR